MEKLVALSLILFTLSCQKTDVDIDYSLPTPEGLVHWDILKVEGKHSISLNDTLFLDVYCPRTTSCDYISQLLPNEHGNRILIKAFGNSRKNSPCLMFAFPQVLPYEFVPKNRGHFSLDFIKKDHTIIRFDVNVY